LGLRAKQTVKVLDGSIAGFKGSLGLTLTNACPMIRHIVMFSCQKVEDREAIFRGLSVLTSIEHASVLEVSYNEKIDQIANDMDVVVYGEFASLDAFRAYKAHPLYEESIRRVRHLRDVRVAADYTVSNATRTPIPA